MNVYMCVHWQKAEMNRTSKQFANTFHLIHEEEEEEGKEKKEKINYTHYYYILNFLIVSSYGWYGFLSLLIRVKHIKKKVYECRIVCISYGCVYAHTHTQCINGHNQQQIQQSHKNDKRWWYKQIKVVQLNSKTHNFAVLCSFPRFPLKFKSAFLYGWNDDDAQQFFFGNVVFTLFQRLLVTMLLLFARCVWIYR